MDRKVGRRGLLKGAAAVGGGLLLGRRFRDLIAGSHSQLGNELPHKVFLPLVCDELSTVYRATGFPVPTWVTEYHEGVDALLELMGGEGLKFYRTDEVSPWGGPRGLIASDDVVLIKINSQWPERGMTNTDVLRGLISRIVAHSEGFIGEVVVVENTQHVAPHFEDEYDNNDDSPDHGQSAMDVVTRFAGQGYAVSLKSWTAINQIQVSEYSEDNNNDGYVLAGGYPFNYPKFTTAQGTKVSLRYGIWDGEDYDASRLRFLNVPVLKFHSGFGLTAAVKHFVGFLSRFVGEEQAPGEDTFAFHSNLYEDWNGQPKGILGRLLALRFPDLNIVDATYVGIHHHTDCPIDDPAKSVEVRSLLASRDPVAVDYYSSKHILYPLKLAAGHGNAEQANPDADNLLRAYLLASRERLLEATRPANFGDEQIHLVEYRFPE